MKMKSKKSKVPVDDPIVDWYALLEPVRKISKKIKALVRKHNDQFPKDYLNENELYPEFEKFWKDTIAVGKKVGLTSSLNLGLSGGSHMTGAIALADIIDSFINDPSTSKNTSWFWNELEDTPAKLQSLKKSMAAMTPLLSDLVDEALPMMEERLSEISALTKKEKKAFASTKAKDTKADSSAAEAEFEEALNACVEAIDAHMSVVKAIRDIDFDSDFGDDIIRKTTQGKSNKYGSYPIEFLYDHINPGTAVSSSGVAKELRKTFNSLKQAKVNVDVFVANVKGIPGALARAEKVLGSASKRLEDEAEAPQKAVMGRIAFPTHRKGRPFEPDTKKEMHLYDALQRHFEGDGHLNAADANTIRVLLSRGWYADVFKQPSASTVFRGMSVPEKWLQKALKTKKVSKKGSLEKSFTYKPRHGLGSSSWSTKKSVATKFSNEGRRDDYKIIMHAYVEDNPSRFVSGPGGLYKVDGLDGYTEEAEAVALGKIKVYKVEWRPADEW